jgi:hypothetical protein
MKSCKVSEGRVDEVASGCGHRVTLCLLRFTLPGLAVKFLAGALLAQSSSVVIVRLGVGSTSSLSLDIVGRGRSVGLAIGFALRAVTGSTDDGNAPIERLVHMFMMISLQIGNVL